MQFSDVYFSTVKIALNMISHYAYFSTEKIKNFFVTVKDIYKKTPIEQILWGKYNA